MVCIESDDRNLGDPESSCTKVTGKPIEGKVERLKAIRESD